MNAPFQARAGLRDPFTAFVCDDATADMLRPVAVEHGWGMIYTLTASWELGNAWYLQARLQNLIFRDFRCVAMLDWDQVNLGGPGHRRIAMHGDCHGSFFGQADGGSHGVGVLRRVAVPLLHFLALAGRTLPRFGRRGHCPPETAL